MHCRAGSLESKKQRNKICLRMHCRAGSLETHFSQESVGLGALPYSQHTTASPGGATLAQAYNELCNLLTST